MKTCLILGSNSDVGQATANIFAKNGFNIILAARRIDDYQKRLKSDISIKHKVEVSNLFFEGTDYKQHSKIVSELEIMPDVIVTVFGYLGEQETASKDFDEAYNILSTNYIGHVSFLNSFAQRLKSSGTKGTIIGVSSVAGDRGRQSNYIYGSAKAGFSAYLSGLRNELSRFGIHVVTVKPGFINTKMIEGLSTPKPLTAQPQDAASAIFKAYKKKKNIIYVLPIWKLIMLIIKHIPEGIFKKLKL